MFFCFNNKDKIFELYSYFDEQIIKKINEYKNELTFNNFEIISKINNIIYKNKLFYFFLYTKITSKIIDIISYHKNESIDIANIKKKLNKIIKIQLLKIIKNF